MSSVVNNERIPNNVDLAADKKLQRALEAWQPKYISWWKEMGPEGFQEDQVYLRTAVSVDHEGWANFDYVKMPDYRWGIFLTEPTRDRTIPFGDFMGQPVWQAVPGEHRNMLRRLVVTQGDTEPASVEQQRLLGQSCPSVYDLRNLFQVNVEEGRHLWAMVYLLQSYFGRDGREEAEGLLERRSGNPDKPRILGAFNEPCANWLSFFMFTYFTDRDGKYQLLALAESGFDPLARTCRFMLTEEAHHMFVGETGVLRIVQRTCELMKKNKSEDARAEGGIDLPTMQKYMNFWFSVSLDLFGGEVSSNCRHLLRLESSRRRAQYEETYPDHLARQMASTSMAAPPGRRLQAGERAPPQRHERGAPRRVRRGRAARRRQVEPRHRRGGPLRPASPCPAAASTARSASTPGSTSTPPATPSPRRSGPAMPRRPVAPPAPPDEAYVKSLMTRPIFDPKQMANWIAPPPRGIKGKPVDFEYVKHGE